MSHDPAWLPTTPPLRSVTAFDDAVATHSAVVVHVWAVWDGHDRTVDAVLQEIRPEFEGRIAFFSLDYDDRELWDILRRYDVTSPPVLLCFADGHRRGSVLGVHPREALQARLEALLTG